MSSLGMLVDTRDLDDALTVFILKKSIALCNVTVQIQSSCFNSRGISKTFNFVSENIFP